MRKGTPPLICQRWGFQFVFPDRQSAIEDLKLDALLVDLTGRFGCWGVPFSAAPPSAASRVLFALGAQLAHLNTNRRVALRSWLNVGEVSGSNGL